MGNVAISVRWPCELQVQHSDVPQNVLYHTPCTRFRCVMTNIASVHIYRVDSWVTHFYEHCYLLFSGRLNADVIKIMKVPQKLW